MEAIKASNIFDKELRTKVPIKRNSKVILYNVAHDTTEGQLVEALYKQNNK